ncbi:MAG: ABC transporter ATP-binding protein [Alphaproteobacteria bacterium]|nr:ABC transporter ATP-binding protein [Alphaproteobacteria bacterium]
MAESNQPVVRLTNVKKTYKLGSSQVQAVRGISLAVPPRCFTMIVGPSGSGKTTLLNLIGCIDRPSSGTVEIAGQDIARLGDNALSDLRARRIGFIFQSFSLIPVLSAYENVEYPLLSTDISAKDRRRAVLDMLDAVGLKDQRSQRPNELSGGQKQRVAIARALVKQPEFVLADEPTANLDSGTGASIIELMRKMQVEKNTSFIFSTHDPQLISHADKTFAIRDGLLVDQSAGGKQ